MESKCLHVALFFFLIVGEADVGRLAGWFSVVLIGWAIHASYLNIVSAVHR